MEHDERKESFPLVISSFRLIYNLPDASIRTTQRLYIKKASFKRLSCGLDGTRTRDPLRDRQVF